MKVIIREEIKCDHDNLKKYLPSRFVPLVHKRFFGQTVTLICFPNVSEVVTSNGLKKALKKVKNTDITVLFFAYNFTVEAVKIINETGGEEFTFSNFDWKDEEYSRIRNSIHLF